MDKAFQGLINNFVLVYLDYVTIFSKKDNEHVDYLRYIFERCREYGVSLNPKKSIFAVHEGKLLGYIVSKHRITIDLEIITTILQIPLLAHKKGLS